MARMMEGKPLLRVMQMMRHWLRPNTRAGSRRNIHAHYDLGNRFYGAWLDHTMTYSSAIFDEAKDLAGAQIAKYRALARQIRLTPDCRVLEIGCGWGGFAELAAKEFGCSITGLTISREQYDFARKRIFDAGLAEKVEIKMQDYRDERGLFDRIASIEMFEAVGEAYWPKFFQQLRDRLTAGGLAGLQVITIHEGLFAQYRRELDFIRRYIFPGGMLPTAAIMRDLGNRHELPFAAERVFGLHYAATLAAWRERFRAAWPSLAPLGFDERFRRMWEYYLSYCEAGFRAGTIDVRQMVFARS
jgi:cyclopropane-fatty-acyl-phospholipid synthase